MFNKLVKIFECANRNLLLEDKELFDSEISERTLCGALMIHLVNALKETDYSSYNVDVEYNRNKNGKLKTITKTIEGPDEKIIRVNCDLIVHSRGKIPNQDNLIAIEMKKSSRPKDGKDKDRERLMALTKDSFNDIWSFDGKSLPEHVCRYVLGVYYEINFRERTILLEYYKRGKKVEQKEILMSKKSE